MSENTKTSLGDCFCDYDLKIYYTLRHPTFDFNNKKFHIAKNFTESIDTKVPTYITQFLENRCSYQGQTLYICTFSQIHVLKKMRI